MTSRGSLLVVCTANVCRSPLAEQLIRDRFAADGVDATIDSAGVRALEGSAMCPVSEQQLPAGEQEDHVARQVEAADVRGADLAVAMEREQRGALVREAPGSQSKVFTLREATALAEALVARGERPEDLAGVARAMHGLRGLVVVPADEPPKRRWWQRPVEPDDPLTLIDGHGLPEPEHRAAVERVHEFADRFAAALTTLLR